jgi:hypothetical protein
VVNVTLVPGSVGVYAVEFQLNSGLAPNPLTQLTIAQQAFVSNVVTFAVTSAPAYLLNATAASSSSSAAASSTRTKPSVVSVPAKRSLARPEAVDRRRAPGRGASQPASN